VHAKKNRSKNKNRNRYLILFIHKAPISYSVIIPAKPVLKPRRKEIHMLFGAPPRNALSGIVQIMKRVSAKKELREFPEITEQL
jgi:hypothetical protein